MGLEKKDTILINAQSVQWLMYCSSNDQVKSSMQQTAVYKLTQKMLEVSQRNLANITAQIADVK